MGKCYADEGEDSLLETEPQVPITPHFHLTYCLHPTHLHWLGVGAGQETHCSSVVLAAGGTGAVGP